VVKRQTDVSKKALATADAILARDAASNAAEARHAIIAEAAYLRAEQRHFAPGYDIEDWLAAESALNRHRTPVNATPAPHT
jgi:hypothetical protein